VLSGDAQALRLPHRKNERPGRIYAADPFIAAAVTLIAGTGFATAEGTGMRREGS